MKRNVSAQRKIDRVLATFIDTALETHNWNELSVLDAHTRIDSIEEEVGRHLAIDQRPLISPSATIHPTALLGPGVVVGPGATVGPYSYLRSNVVLFPGVQIGYGVELDRIIVHSETKIAHSASLGRGIIGPNCNLGFGAVMATHRLDGRPVRVKGPDYSTLYESTRRHHGALLGASVITGVNVAFMPGASVAPELRLFPATIHADWVVN